MDRRLENLGAEFLEAYRRSGYPHKAFGYRGHGVRVQIRIPPIPPVTPIEVCPDWPRIFAACPAIEDIEIVEPLRRKGMFTFIVQLLGSLDEVEYVCVTNVMNESFRSHLESHRNWEPLRPPGQQLTRPVSFFRRIAKRPAAREALGG